MAKPMEAVVIFDYDKQQDDEISLKVGEIVQDVKQVDEGWCEGTVHGNRGLFPDNFVKKRQPGHTTAPTTAAALPSTPLDQPASSGAILRDTKDKSRRAKVTYSYVAENPDELSLQPGQTVEIIAEEEEGWWKGRTGGHEGVFPSNFVELVSDQGKSPPSTTDGPDKPEGPSRQSVFGPKVMPNFNPLEARKQLKSTASKPSLPPVAAPSPKHEEPKRAAPLPPSQTRPPLPPPPAVEKAKVIFDYTAEQDDEVNIKVGDIVEVLDKDAQEGWWEIQHGDQKGLIPDNFVEVLPSQTSPSTPSKKPHTPTTDSKPDPPVPAKEPAPALPSRPSTTKRPPPPPMEVKRPPLPKQESVETKRPTIPPHRQDSKVKLEEEEGADFGVPSTQPLDNSAVKSRPKKSVGSRPPSRSNLHLEDASSQPQAEPQLSPWQQEMHKRKLNKPQPPPPKPSFSRKPPPTKPGAKPPFHPEAETKPPPSKPAVTAAPRSTAPPVKPAEAKPPPPPPPSETVQSPPSSTESGAWKEVFEKLREEMDLFKHEYLKDIEILTEDLDKERKLRAALEIEVDRLKKSREFRNKL